MVVNIEEAYIVYIINIDNIKIMSESELNTFKKMLKNKFYEKYKYIKMSDIISEEEIKKKLEVIWNEDGNTTTDI